jgi:hypothetical protein
MKIIHYFIAALLLMTVGLASAADTEKKIEKPDEITAFDRGEELHDQECTSCHGDALYTRHNRRIKTYESLKTHVQRCATNLNKQWWPKEIEDVATYLNEQYYLLDRN